MKTPKIPRIRKSMLQRLVSASKSKTADPMLYLLFKANKEGFINAGIRQIEDHDNEAGIVLYAERGRYHGLHAVIHAASREGNYWLSLVKPEE